MTDQVTVSHRKQRLIAMLGAAATCAGLMAIADPPPAGSALVDTPRVICVTSYRPPEGAYRRKPHKCEFHHRGDFPIAGVNTAPTGRLHWKLWGHRHAVAKGKFFISTYGPAPAKVKLSRPRRACGTSVFTKVRIKYRTHFNGQTHHDRFHMLIDNCLS